MWGHLKVSNKMMTTNNKLNTLNGLIYRLEKGIIRAQDISVIVDTLSHVESLREAAVSATNKEKSDIVNDLLALDVLVNDFFEHYEKSENKVFLSMEVKVDEVVFTKGSSLKQKVAPLANSVSVAHIPETNNVTSKAPIWF